MRQHLYVVRMTAGEEGGMEEGMGALPPASSWLEGEADAQEDEREKETGGRVYLKHYNYPSTRG